MAATMSAPIRVAVRGEREPLAIRRPGGSEKAVGPGGITLHLLGASEVAYVAAADVQHPDVGPVTVACGDEGDPPAIRREHGCVVHRGVREHGVDAGPVGAGAE